MKKLALAVICLGLNFPLFAGPADYAPLGTCAYSGAPMGTTPLGCTLQPGAEGANAAVPSSPAGTHTANGRCATMIVAGMTQDCGEWVDTGKTSE